MAWKYGEPRGKFTKEHLMALKEARHQREALKAIVIKKCKHCGIIVTNFLARGFCGPCYHRWRKRAIKPDPIYCQGCGKVYYYKKDLFDKKMTDFSIIVCKNCL